MPSTALVFQEHGTQVAVVTADERVHLKPIAVSKLMDHAVEVAEGLAASDRIINNPSAGLLEGKQVRVVTRNKELGVTLRCHVARYPHHTSPFPLSLQ